MAATFSDRIDCFWRQHPRLLIWTTVLMAILATLTLLANTDYNVILYKGF